MEVGIEYSSHFKSAYRKLPLAVQKRAEQKEILFRKNPFDIKLRTHKLHGKLKQFSSFSVDFRYRIVFKFTEQSRVVFLGIGDHDVYQ